MSGREVTLVLCTADGDLLGAAAPFTVDNSWWNAAEDVVATARTALGVDVRVLRILHMPSEADSPCGGSVAYLAEVDSAPTGVELRAWPGDPLAPHPNRLPYAQPGGHRPDLEWAITLLADRGIALTTAPTQVRTWNLSSISSSDKVV